MSADQSGVAAIELGIFAPLLFLALVNVVDVTIYLYQRMQVQNATQVAAQAAWKACDLPKLPATVNCPGLTTAIQNALASTSLGTGVSLVSGSPAEGYYCVNSSNALQYVSDVTSKPLDCTAAGTPSLQPGDYIQVQSTFTYARPQHRQHFPDPDQQYIAHEIGLSAKSSEIPGRRSARHHGGGIRNYCAGVYRLDYRHARSVRWPVPHWVSALCGGRKCPLRFHQNQHMLGFGNDHCLCAEPLFRPGSVTHLHIRCRCLWQFGERVGQLFDERRIQNFHDSNFGGGLLSVSVRGQVHRHHQFAAITTNLKVERIHDRRQGQDKVQQVLDDVSRTRAEDSQRLSEAMPALS
jgi:hypothetical protein